MLYCYPMFRGCRPDEIRIRRIRSNSQRLSTPSASFPASMLRAHPEALTNPITKLPGLNAHPLGRLLDLEPVLVCARGEPDGHMGSAEPCVAGEDVGEEEGMKMTDVGGCRAVSLEMKRRMSELTGVDVEDGCGHVVWFRWRRCCVISTGLPTALADGGGKPQGTSRCPEGEHGGKPVEST